MTDQIPADAITAVTENITAFLLGCGWAVADAAEVAPQLADNVLAAAAPVIAAQAAAAERERIRQLAIRVEAEYSDGDDGEICCDDDCHLIWKPFAELLETP